VGWGKPAVVRLAWALLVPLCAGCVASEATFSEATTRIGCRFEQDCDPDTWDREGFANVGECVDARFDQDADDFPDLCGEYNPKAARACLVALRKNRRQCGDFYEESSIDGPCRDVCESGAVVNSHGVGVPFF